MTINSSCGRVISVRGSVVDVLFFDTLPAIHSLLITERDRSISLEVITYLDSDTVRTIAPQLKD